MTVRLDVPELPAATVKLVADTVKLPVAEPTVTKSEPVDAAYVESPEYVALMICEPLVVEEKL